MSEKKLFQLLCFGLFITMCLSIPRALSQINDEQRKNINGRLEDVATLLSVPLYDPDVRDLILEETKASRVLEQKLDLSNIVVSARNLGGDGISRSPAVWDAIDDAINDLNEAVRGARPDPNAAPISFDLYFPVEGHRQNWDGSTDLLLASAPVDDVNVTEMTAFSIADGSVVRLDPYSPPVTPTLIVGINEKQLDEPTPPMVELPGDANVPDEENPAAPDANDANSYIGIPWIKLLCDQEPWWKGSPEVYVLVTQTTFVDKVYKKNLAGVNKVGKWYWLGDGPCYPLYFYYNNLFSKVTKFHFKEDDWPDSDDHLGCFCINRDYVPWCGYKTYANYCVVIDVDKDP